MTNATANRADSALQTNLARLGPLLERVRSEGLGHVIDGVTSRAVDGEVFANHTPVDGSLICQVARGTAADVDRAALAAQKAFPGWRDVSAARRRDLLHAIADAIERRADDIAVLESWDSGQPIRFMSKAALRGAENFRFYADRAESARDGVALPTDTHLNYTVTHSDRSGRRHHAVEHALHAVDLEDRTGAGCGLHGGSQARRVEPGHRAAARADRARGRAAARRAQCRARSWRGGRLCTDRAPRHTRDRVRRRVSDRLGDHAAGVGDAEAPALRARRQEPGDRVRRRGSRARARRGDIHDLQPERRALHLVEPVAHPGIDRRGVHRTARGARPPVADRASARPGDRSRTADPRAAPREGVVVLRGRAWRRCAGRRGRRSR